MIFDKVIADCAGCGGDITENMPIYIVDGDVLHACLECSKEYVNPDYYHNAEEARQTFKIDWGMSDD